MSGNIVLKLVGVWATRSAQCDVSSFSMKAQTALSTANTAVGKSLRSDSHATECHAQASGGPGPGQRYVVIHKNGPGLQIAPGQTLKEQFTLE